MRRFVYFLQNYQGAVSRAECATAGKLEYAFPKNLPFAAKQVDGGELGAGVLCCCGESAGLEFNAETHEYHAMTPARPGVFIGVPRKLADRPGPDDLLLAEQMLSEGERLVLNDGYEYNIPVCRFLLGDTALPRVLIYDQGEIVWKTKQEYRELFSMSESIVRRLLLEADAEYTPGEIARWVGLALGVNYRIRDDEVCHLGLICSTDLEKISNIIIDGAKLASLLQSFQRAMSAP